jgi:hypothetical protein
MEWCKLASMSIYTLSSRDVYRSPWPRLREDNQALASQVRDRPGKSGQTVAGVRPTNQPENSPLRHPELRYQ